LSERRPLIGLTIGPDSGYLRVRSTYTQAIEQAGGVPVLIPPLEQESLRTLLEVLDGLVLPGGLDVDPSHYGEARAERTEVNPDLDRLELAVSRWALNSGLPTLGICRGQQLLNVACGGKLLQHIEQHRQGEPRDLLTHALEVEPGSRLAEILGAHLEVNTHHHQAVCADALGQGLRPVAWSPDGIVEGLEGETHPWLLAVQFHPEDLVGFHEPSRRLFRAFIEACARIPVA
jgi:putative glutamine amidotransferase